MGLIKAFAGAAGGVLGDQWKDYFYCDALTSDTIVAKSKKRQTSRSSNINGSENIISTGSIIAVADGQCMLIVEQGKVVEVCAEPGEYVFDSSTESSIFAGSLNGGNLSAVFHNIGKRFTFGGETPKEQRVYYINTKELVGNPYGTPAPVPFRIVDKNVGLDVDISIKCFGEYSYKVTNPILFYTNVCGNVDNIYTRDLIDDQLKSELLTSLQPAFAEISEKGIRYSALPKHTSELAETLNKILSSKWKDLRGIEIVSLGISSLKANEKDEEMIKELQRNAVFKDPTMAAAQLVGAQSIAMQEAAKNQNAGPAMAFMGMNMANQAGGINAQNLFEMGMKNQQLSQIEKDNEEWTCSCGKVVKGKFCSYCGKSKDKKEYVCSKCGWKTNNQDDIIKFCPNCGNQL